MSGEITARLFNKAIKRASENGSSLFKSLAIQPFRLIAAFFTAPFLLYRVARKVKNPIRRNVAKVGIFIAVIVTYLAGTLLGTTVAALLIATKLGPIIGLAFLLGTWLSMLLSVLFQLLVFNTITFLFLQMSRKDVVDYLDEISS